MKQVPVNIKIKFGKAVVKLPKHTDYAITNEGVKLYLKMKPANEVQAMAEIPDGTLEQYKHCRPIIVSCDWVAA